MSSVARSTARRCRSQSPSCRPGSSWLADVGARAGFDSDFFLVIEQAHSLLFNNGGAGTLSPALTGLSIPPAAARDQAWRLLGQTAEASVYSFDSRAWIVSARRH